MTILALRFHILLKICKTTNFARGRFINYELDCNILSYLHRGWHNEYAKIQITKAARNLEFENILFNFDKQLS